VWHSLCTVRADRDRGRKARKLRDLPKKRTE
jgi:hypothetical protein